MKYLVLFFLAIVVAVIVGLLMFADPGYVLIAYKNWSIESTLWIFLSSILLLFLLLYLITALFRNTNYLAKKVHYWTAQRQLRWARKQTNLGLCDWAEGKWKKAEKRLIKVAKESEVPLINYLIAARAAQASSEYDKRDLYLQKAHKSTPGVALAVGLTQAQLQLAAGQYERALATLKHMQQLAPKHAYVIRLLQQVYMELKDWENLQKLLPQLRKYKVFKAKKLLKIERQVYLELLKIKNAQLIWQQVPDDLQIDPLFLVAYTDALIKARQGQIAERALHNALKREWNQKLIANYGLAEGADSSKQLVFAESWLKFYPRNSVLLFALGQICQRQNLWGKAQKYFQQAASISNNPAAYRELGRIMETLGNKSAALDYYRKMV